MAELETFPERNRVNQNLSGALIFAIAGSLWAAYGSFSLKEFGEPWLAIGVILTGLCLLSAVFFLRMKAARLPAVILSPALQKREAQAGRMFVIVNAMQGAAIFAAANVCVNLSKSEYVSPVIALIVGLHFIALAYFMQTRFHLLIGGLMCLLAVLTTLTVPMYAAGKDTAAHSVFLWGPVVGLGSCVILWSSAISRLRAARKAMSAETSINPSAA